MGEVSGLNMNRDVHDNCSFQLLMKIWMVWRSGILQGPDKTPVLELVPPPELHLLLGVVNHVFDSLNKLWKGDKAFNWAKEKCHSTSTREQQS